MMASISSRTYFLTLAACACFLLWGTSLWNGTVKALVKATINEQFEDGTPLKTNYTGIYTLDFPLSLLVAFFFYGTNGTDRGYQIFLIDAYSSLQVAFTWLHAEACRVNAKTFTVSNPIIWGLLWQAFGGAISLPLYFLSHLEWLRGSKQPCNSVSLARARALPISFLWGAVIPAVIGMLPTWIDRSAITHQNILAFWQLDPLLVSAFHAAASWIFSRAPPDPETAERLSVWWTRAAYITAAACSATGHFYAVFSIMGSSDSQVGFIRLYIPFLSRGPSDPESRLLSGPWEFLRYDLIIIALSSLSWAYLLVKNIARKHAFSASPLPLTLGISGLVLGPGTTVSLVLFWREGILHQERNRANKRFTAKAG